MARIKLDVVGYRCHIPGCSYKIHKDVDSIPDFKNGLAAKNSNRENQQGIKGEKYGTCQVYTKPDKPDSKNVYAAYRGTGDDDVDLYVSAYEEARAAIHFGLLGDISAKLLEEKKADIDFSTLKSDELKASAIAISALYSNGIDPDTIPEKLKGIYIRDIGAQFDGLIDMFNKLKEYRDLSLDTKLAALTNELNERRNQYIEPSKLTEYLSGLIDKYSGGFEATVSELEEKGRANPASQSIFRRLKPKLDVFKNDRRKFLRNLEETMVDYNEVSPGCFAEALDYYKGRRIETESAEEAEPTLEETFEEDQDQTPEPAPVQTSGPRIRTTTHFYQGKAFRTERRTVKVDFLPNESGQNVDFVVH